MVVLYGRPNSSHLQRSPWFHQIPIARDIVHLNRTSISHICSWLGIYFQQLYETIILNDNQANWHKSCFNSLWSKRGKLRNHDLVRWERRYKAQGSCRGRWSRGGYTEEPLAKVVFSVIPAEAGIQNCLKKPGFRVALRLPGMTLSLLAQTFARPSIISVLFEFWISNLFRISKFGFRIYRATPQMDFLRSHPPL